MCWELLFDLCLGWALVVVVAMRWMCAGAVEKFMPASLVVSSLDTPSPSREHRDCHATNPPVPV